MEPQIYAPVLEFDGEEDEVFRLYNTVKCLMRDHLVEIISAVIMTARDPSHPTHVTRLQIIYNARNEDVERFKNDLSYAVPQIYEDIRFRIADFSDDGRRTRRAEEYYERRRRRRRRGW